ncbi:MAG: glycosyltransferase family 4 protein [Acidimicrobiia bacterium]|nr:glycosyltransferase family 4 protein [Acidimicrobiia bacterium]
MRVLFVAWRDLAHPQAGGSEVLVDRLALGLIGRGREAAVLCGGPVAPRPYPVVDAGGTYSQYLRAPFAYRRHFSDVDLVVDVENGIPFFSPLWRRKPVLCLVHHVHEDQWATRFSGPVARLGRVLEGRAMPAVYGRSLFLAVSESTRRSLTGIGVPESRIRVITEGVDVGSAAPDVSRSPTPLFVVLGRLVPHKRVELLLRAWRVVHQSVGGELIIIGDGPERERLQAIGGPGVTFAGHVSEHEKWQLLQRAWLLVHGAHHEGWGIAVVEAAACRTPALAFDVPGVRDAVVDGETGVLVDYETELTAAWVHLSADPQARRRLGDAARRRAEALSWDATVSQFVAIAEEAVALPRADVA